MRENEIKKNRKRQLTSASMLAIGAIFVVGGAFAALSDTLTHNESVTIEWVEIVDNSDDDLALENSIDNTNTPVTELTPGYTYELTGTIENDSTVMTEWIATDLTTVTGMNVEIADPDGNDTPTNPGEAVDVSQFGITVEVDQSVSASSPLNFVIEFTANDARNTTMEQPTLDAPTPISDVFPDPALATCVANMPESGAAGDVNALISQEQLDTFSVLTCESKNIVRIEGVQYMKNLTEVHFFNNNISDLTPLATAYNLTTIDMYDNQISDVSPLANLENLEVLDLSENLITNISPLANNESLVVLILDGNQISDITAVANLTNLRFFSAQDNQISDLTPLSELNKLRYLVLNVNNISDLSPIANLTNLTYLSLSANNISDINPLANLTNLEDLYLDSNHIADFSPLPSQPLNFSANNQTVDLPDVTLGTPTSIYVDGVNGNSLQEIWVTSGTYDAVAETITWDQTGENMVKFQSYDGEIEVTVTQTVN